MSGLAIDGARLNISPQYTNATQATAATTATDSVTPQDLTGATGTDGTGKAASVHISKAAQLYSKLQQLQQQDPAKFKAVLSDAASKLQEAAKSATGKEQTFLSNLADKFQKAADGDLSALAPPQPPANKIPAAYAQNGQANDQGSAPLAANGKPHGHHGPGHNAAVQSVFADIDKAIDAALSGGSSTTPATNVQSA